jgi:hypothetical protein
VNPPKSPLERGTLKAPFPRGLGDLDLTRSLADLCIHGSLREGDFSLGVYKVDRSIEFGHAKAIVVAQILSIDHGKLP